MKIATFILIFLFFTLTEYLSQVNVRSYYRKDGTFVQSHLRTFPDGNVFNNWSTKGNINPYNLKEGTINPYREIVPKTKVYSNYISYPYNLEILNEVNTNQIKKVNISPIFNYQNSIFYKKELNDTKKKIKKNRIIIYD